MAGAQLDVEHSTREAGARTVQLLALTGQLDAHTYPTLEAALEGLTDPGGAARYVVLDLAGLEYISSAGIGVVNKMANRFRQDEGDVRLAELRPDVDSVFKLLGFNRVIKLFPTVDAAVASFRE